MSKLYLVGFQPGGGHNSVGRAIDENGRLFTPAHTQGVLNIRLDQFPIFGRQDVRVPKFIKIDVDGIEDEVVFGFSDWLDEKKLTEILVETNIRTTRGRRVRDMLTGAGFSEEEPARLRQGRGNYIYRRI